MQRYSPLKATLVLITALSSSGLASAQNSKLDAPVSRQPTVKSEIKRGEDAGFKCGLDHILSFSRFIDCISENRHSNEQRGTFSDPFKLGLNMYSLRHALAQKIAADPMLPLWKNEAVQIMKAYKLSAIDYCKAIESEKCDDANEWVSKALGTPLATTPSATKPQKQTPPGPLPLR